MCNMINKKEILNIFTDIVLKIIIIWKGVERGYVSYHCTLKMCSTNFYEK
jgi:hypothetical protein